MTDILIQLIEDVGILGAEVTELILEQFDKFEKVTIKVCLIKKKPFFFIHVKHIGLG
jgi:hypothetical protein